jgi:large conductance mechanosensitive channel
MAKSTFWADFKAFAMKGNVIDMAIGVVIGAAFGKIVTSLVNDVIMPLVGLLVGGFNFSDLKITLHKAIMDGDTVVKDAVYLNYGNFIQETVNFLIIAFCIFLVIKGIANVKPTGHIIIRVYPGGKSWQVFVLDPYSSDYSVKYVSELKQL